MVEDVDTDFLMDTAASLIMISETLFRSIPNHLKLLQVEVPACFCCSLWPSYSTFRLFPDDGKSFRLIC